MTTRSVAIAALAALALANPVLADDDDNDGRGFQARLTGDQEVPPVETRTRGRAHFTVNRGLTEIRFFVKVRVKDDDVGLLGFAGAHIHCAPAGENGPVVAFLAGDVPGGLIGKVEFGGTLTDDNIVNPACGVDIAELVDAMRDGDTYVNVHSLMNQSGEVRGQIGRGGDDD